MTSNQEIADILYQIADLMEMQDVAFKPQAYRRAAQTVERWSEEVEDVAKRGGPRGAAGGGQRNSPAHQRDDTPQRAVDLP